MFGLDDMRWSEPLLNANEEEGPPTIKNHSVTHFNGTLYCFGGYDGRRNHQTLLLYSIRDQTWTPAIQAGEEQAHHIARRHVVTVSGTPPAGRNGHTATLATDDEEHGRIIILGGWLGTGPLAAQDLHVLEISPMGLRWHQPTIKGIPPGPCNMHSSDFCPSQRLVYVFRGGNGREYLNDLHALNVDTYTWSRVETTGTPPQQRANHSSALLEETNELFIFGGWNGRERLNDIHILDTTTSTWTRPHVGGILPHPRAGMTLTAMHGRLFLFGGSGTSSKCFQDLQILDRNKMAWLDVMQNESTNPSRSSNFYDPDNSQSDGGNNHQAGNSLALSHASDWRTRDNMDAVGLTMMGNANPNDEDTLPGIMIQGQGPGRRAGHTATAVNRQLFVFGGSCGSDYLNDFFVLDTDPPPRARVEQPTSLQLLERRLRHFFNDEEFSDVTFVVENQRVYGHKLVLSLVSDCFRAMFTTSSGFRESEAGAEIEIPNCSYEAFYSMMEYIYTGRVPKLLPGAGNMEAVVSLLELADQFILDHLKEKCETLLQTAVNVETSEYLYQVALKTNAAQLRNICEHFERNQDRMEVEGL